MSEENVVRTGAPGQPPHRIPAVAEALGYVGGALALAAVAVLVSAFWGPLGPWGRVGVAALAAAAGLAGGFTVERLHSPAAQRLAQFLLFAGVAGAGSAVGLLVQHLASSADNVADWAWFSGFAAAAIAGGAIWWTRRTRLQHFAFGIPVGVSALLALPLVPIDGPEWGAGAVLALVGIVWGWLSLRGRLEPVDASLSLACLGLLGGIELMAVTGEDQIVAWPLWIGVAVSLALIGGGIPLRRPVVFGLGAVGLMLFAVELLVEVFGESIATPVAMLVAGIACLAGGTYLALRAGAADGRPAMAAELVSYVGVAFSMAGGGTLLGEYSDRLGTYGRIIVPAVGMLVAYGTGLLMSRIETKSARRLSQVLLGLGPVLAGVTAGMIAQPIANNRFAEFRGEGIDYRGVWTGTIGTGTAALAGLLTWWVRRGAITAIAFALALFALSQVVFDFVPFESQPFWARGATLAVIGIAWVVLAMSGVIEPPNSSIAVGSLGVLFGMQQMMRGPMGGAHTWAVWTALGVSLIGIVAAIRFRRGVLLGFGAAGVVLFSITGIMEFFAGQIAGPILLLVAGVVFIAMAVFVAVIWPRIRGGERQGTMHAV